MPDLPCIRRALYTPSIPKTPARPGKLVLIIGPSGVGKSVLLKMLRRNHPELRFPRSATTRPRRPKEGMELYRFVTDGEFDAHLAKNEFLETAVVHGGARYGTLLDEIIPPIKEGKIAVREVDVQGFESIRKHPLFARPFDGAQDSAPYLLQSIFILPDSKEKLIERIRRRAPISDGELRHRIASMDRELLYARHCDAEVRNREGHLNDTYHALEKLIVSKKAP